MTRIYGTRREQPRRVRLLNEETESEKYQRLGWDPRKTYAENMGYEGVFDRPDEDLDWPESPQRRKPSRQVRQLAAEGRGNDTEIAHVARGEFVIPQAFQTPELIAALRRVAAAHGVPLDMLSVGNAGNRINPNTGAPEFGVMDGRLEAPDIGSFENAAPDFPDANITVSGEGPIYRAPESGIGTLPIPPEPSTERSPAPGIGGSRFPYEPSSDYAPRMDPGRGPMPFPGGVSMNGSAYRDDFNPLRNAPVPGYTDLTPAKPNGQGSGDIRDRKNRDGSLRGHYGVDFAVPAGTAVVAPGDGQVVTASQLDGYGNQVTIKHANGFTTQSAHLGSIDVKPGDYVKAGQTIGVSGDGRNKPAAGNAFGLDPQVHFEVRGGTGRDHKSNYGIIYNPLPYLRGRGASY